LPFRSFRSCRVPKLGFVSARRGSLKGASSAGRGKFGDSTPEGSGMTFLIALAIVSGLLLGVGRPGEKPNPLEDLQKIQGVWRGIELEIKGDSLPPPCARSLWLRFDKDTFTIEQGGKITVQGRYTIDPASKPKTIELTIIDTVQAVNKGALVLGIYELQKNQLRLCTTKANGQDRPKKLVSKRGTTHSLFTFQKEKP
jgi:uncharacterized protein (TIGR03067 family)